MENTPEEISPPIESQAITFEPERVVVKPLHYVLLSIATLSIYNWWWMYKVWRYVGQKENLIIYPAVRTLLALFYMPSLFEKIVVYNDEKEHDVDFNPWALWGGILIIGGASYLPDPFWLLQMLIVLPFLKAVKELNFYFTGNYDGDENAKLSTGEKVVIAIGSIFWLLIVVGLMSE